MAGVPVVSGYQHSSRHLIEGIIRNQVEETLGAAKYEEICNQPTVLRNIHYCQSGNLKLLIYQVNFTYT